jgi:hypothetical protein
VNPNHLPLGQICAGIARDTTALAAAGDTEKAPG